MRILPVNNYPNKTNHSNQSNFEANMIKIADKIFPGEMLGDAYVKEVGGQVKILVNPNSKFGSINPADAVFTFVARTYSIACDFLKPLGEAFAEARYGNYAKENMVQVKFPEGILKDPDLI